MKVIHSSKFLVEKMEALGIERKWTRAQLCNYFKISAPSMSRMRIGRQVPSIDTYIRICNLLKLPLQIDHKKAPKEKPVEPRLVREGSKAKNG